jgi:hypothetical protein
MHVHPSWPETPSLKPPASIPIVLTRKLDLFLNMCDHVGSFSQEEIVTRGDARSFDVRFSLACTITICKDQWALKPFLKDFELLYIYNV